MQQNPREVPSACPQIAAWLHTVQTELPVALALPLPLHDWRVGGLGSLRQQDTWHHREIQYMSGYTALFCPSTCLHFVRSLSRKGKSKEGGTTRDAGFQVGPGSPPDLATLPAPVPCWWPGGTWQPKGQLNKEKNS